jgi:ABC-2 type transport system permease protein
MKKIFAIAIKDTKIRFTSPMEWLFFFVLPIIFTLILSGSTGSNGDPRVQVYVVDQAKNSLSASLITALNNSSSVYTVEKTLDSSLSDFKERKVAAVLIIPATFTEDNLTLANAELDLRQQPNNTSAMVAEQAVQTVVARISSAVDIANASVKKAESIPGYAFKSSADRQTYFNNSLKQAQSLMSDAPVRLAEAAGNTKDSVQYDPRSNSSAGQLITWCFIPLIALSALMAYERQRGTLRRLLTTPTSKAIYLAGTITGQVITALVQMMILVLFGIFLLKLNWGHAPLALAVMLVSSALAAAALGTMLGTFVKTEGQANGLSIMFGMMMALLGGCWYPLELFPQFIQHVVKILPTTWAMQGLLDIVLRGQGLAAVWPNAAVLMGFALVFFVIGVAKFKYE